jgi:hypothetical protein
MAILDGLKNAVTANVTRSANKVAVNGLRNIVGNVFGVDLNPTNPAAQLTNRPTRFTTTMLQYPANVVGDDMQGHYIIFEILVQDKAKLKADRDVKKLKIIMDRDSIDPAATLASNTKNREALKAAEKIAGYAHHNATRSGGGGESGIISLSGDGNSLQLSKKAEAFTATQIALYMPPSLSVSYNSKYGDQEIGVLAASGSGVIDAFAGRGGANFNTALKGALDNLGKGAETGLMAAVDAVAPGSTALLALEKGAIRTPRMELMFEGIGRREFSFEFNFIPKDANEATTIQNIVKQFKLHMASNFTDETFREMEIPDLFNIRYMHKGKQNTHLNKISTCALETMDVSYGGDRFVAVGEDGVPQTTKITLKFKEMEIITKKAIQAGA